MATSFPNALQTFPQMIDLLASDGSLAQQYQTAMQAGNLTLAKQILAQIPNNQNKIIYGENFQKFKIIVYVKIKGERLLNLSPFFF